MNKFIKTNIEYVISVSLILAIFIHMLFLSWNSYADPFLNDHIAYITMNINNSHFSFFDGSLSNLPAFSSFIIILSKVIGVNPSQLRFVPLLGPIFVLFLYMFCNFIFKNHIYSASITYVMYMGFAGPYYSIWPHGFGFLLFIPFIFLFYRIIDKKRWEFILAVFLIFIALHLYSYTAELWAIPFVVLLNIFIYLTAKNKNKNQYLTKSIAISFIVILLTFNELIYKNLSTLNSDRISESIQLFAYRFLNTNSQYAEQFVYQSITPNTLSALNLVYISIIIMPIAIFLLFKVYKFIKIKKIKYFFNKEDAFWFALVLTAIIPILAYSFMGAILMGYILFIYPLIAFFLINKHFNKDYLKYSYLFLIIILITSIVSWNWVVGTSPGGHVISSKNNFKEFEPSANWFLENKENNLFITDHYTGGLYSILGSNKNISIIKSKDYEYYYPNSYTALVDRNYPENETTLKKYYLVINIKYIDKKVWAGGWGDFEPLYLHKDGINLNKNINNIYSDGKVSIFSGKDI